jgi:hypothetical protein
MYQNSPSLQGAGCVTSGFITVNNEPMSAITLGTNLSQMTNQLAEVENLTSYLGDKLGGTIPTQGENNAKNPNVPSIIETTSDAIRTLDRILNNLYRCNQIIG